MRMDPLGTREYAVPAMDVTSAPSFGRVTAESCMCPVFIPVPEAVFCPLVPSASATCCDSTWSGSIASAPRPVQTKFPSASPPSTFPAPAPVGILPAAITAVPTVAVPATLASPLNAASVPTSWVVYSGRTLLSAMMLYLISSTSPGTAPPETVTTVAGDSYAPPVTVA